jgi:hypothetical protein
MTRTLEELREYLVGEWLFQSDFKDSSGNGNHGVPTDIEWKPTSRGLKPHGGKISFGDFTPTNVFTASIWVNVGEWENNYDSIFRLSDIQAGGHPNSSNEAWIIYNYFTGNKINFEIGNDSNYNGAMISYPYFPNNEWHMLTAVCDFKDDNQIRGYLDGQLMDATTITLENISSASMELAIGNYNNQTYDDVKYYNTSLTDDEVLALYESTKHAYGVRPAERSFTHRLQPEVDANTVAAFDMSTKNSDGTLMDLSGNGNHGDIQGAVRAGGYFTDGMMFDGADNRIDVSNDDTLQLVDALTIEMIVKLKGEPNGYTLISKGTSHEFDLTIWTQKLKIYQGENYSSESFESNYVLTADEYIHIIVTRDTSGENINMYFNGVFDASGSMTKPEPYTYPLRIFSRGIGVNPIYGELIFANVLNNELTESQIKSRFNSLATLPLYTFDASKYPTSSGWTSNVPYSSMSISSGEFSFTDDGQLQCDSAGSFTLRNAHEFDGDEYIKLTIDGTVYAGTGIITQGTTTASIEQGSTLITVDMVAGDTIDSIDVQFREPVDE